MDRPAVIAAVALAFVLAGCVGAAEPATVSHTWTGDPDNHWQKQVVTVDYQDPDGDDREYGPLVDRALAYWTQHSEEYAGFDVSVRQAGPGEAADIEIQFVEGVDGCGANVGSSAAGCAPVITGIGQVDRPVDVEVQAGLSDESTVQVLKHELGHTLGLSHDDGPDGVMDATMDLSTIPGTNASDRSMPWRRDELVVYIGLDDVAASVRDDVERQVGAAIHYFMDGADGTVPSNVTFYRAESPESADVVVRYADSNDCRSGAGSCGTLEGDDVDGDGSLEYYTELEVVLSELDSDAVAWHVGRWLGTAFGHDVPGEYPAPLRPGVDHETRRTDWWD